MKVGDKRHLQIARFDRRYQSVKSSGLSASHNAGTTIDKIGAIVNNDSGRRTRTVRIGHGRARTEEHDLRPGRTCLRPLASRLLRDSWRRQHRQGKREKEACEFHVTLRFVRELNYLKTQP